MDTQHLLDLLFVALVSLFAAISPGPNFAIVMNNNLIHSRKIGLFTTLGVSLALMIHLTYTVLGLGVLLTELPILYVILKYTGAFYLFYLGFTSVLSSFQNNHSSSTVQKHALSNPISAWTAVRQGFLTNLLNPKAALFFISLFSQFISRDTPTSLRIEYALVNWTVAISWYIFLSFLITTPFFQTKIQSFRTYIARIMGSFLILLGLKILLAA